MMWNQEKKKSLYTQFSLDKPIHPDPAFAGALCTVCEWLFLKPMLQSFNVAHLLLIT